MRSAWCGLALIALGIAGLPAAEGDRQLLNLKGVPKAERTILPVPVSWPAQEGEGSLCLWKDDKVAVLSLTIDDNCAMNIDWWLKETADRGIQVTWFLVAGGIGRSNPAMNATWDAWKQVRAAGHALESHTVSHLSGSRKMETWQGIAWEYAEAIRLIDEGLGDGHQVTCLAYPGGDYPGKNDLEVAARHYIAARGTKGMLNGPQGLDWLNINAMSKSNLGERPENDFSNADNLLNPQHKSGYRGWCVLLFHYVDEKKPEVVEGMKKKLDWVAERKDRLWVARFNDAARYGQERETAQLVVTRPEPGRIAIALTDRMDDRCFDFPLTVKVRLPQDWAGVQAQQQGKPAAVRTVEHEGARFALVDIIPDRGEAVLTP